MNRVGDSLYHTGENRSLIEAFVSAGVEFVLIGGLAVAWYCDARQADDMDLLINPTPGNSARVACALSGLRLHGFAADSFARLSLQVPLKQNLYAELLTPQPEGPSFEEVARTAIQGKLFDIQISIASAHILIQQKERAIASGKDVAKHKEDIRRLQANAA